MERGGMNGRVILEVIFGWLDHVVHLSTLSACRQRGGMNGRVILEVIFGWLDHVVHLSTLSACRLNGSSICHRKQLSFLCGDR